MNEKRKHARRAVQFQIVVYSPNTEPVTLTVTNVSEGGVFVLAGVQSLPAVCTEITLTPSHLLDSHKPPEIKARVARHTHDGMGIECPDGGFSQSQK